MASYSDTDPMPVRSSGGLRAVAASFNRPNNTTPYAANALVAPVAGVDPSNAIYLPNAVWRFGDAFRLDAMRVHKSSVAALPAFRVWIWRAQPTFTVGDGGAFGNLTGLATADGDKLVDKVDVTMSLAGTAGAVGRGMPDLPTAVTFKPATDTGFWVSLTVLAAYTPAANELFTIVAESVGQ